MLHISLFLFAVLIMRLSRLPFDETRHFELSQFPVGPRILPRAKMPRAIREKVGFEPIT